MNLKRRLEKLEQTQAPAGTPTTYLRVCFVSPTGQEALTPAEEKTLEDHEARRAGTVKEGCAVVTFWTRAQAQELLASTA